METTTTTIMGRGRARVRVRAAAVLTCCLLLATSPAAALAGFCFTDCVSKRCAELSPVRCYFACQDFCDPFSAMKAAAPAAGAVAAPPVRLPAGGRAPALLSSRKLEPANGSEPPKH